MPISNYDTGFPNCLTLRNIPVLETRSSDSNVFWVDSNHAHATDNGPGTFVQPFKTLARALRKIVSDRGDMIYLAAGHEEIITDLYTTLEKSGFSIRGLGIGENKAKCILKTNVTAEFLINGNSTYISNVDFIAEVNNLSLISINSHDIVLEDINLIAKTHKPDYFFGITGGEFHHLCDGLTLRRVSIFMDSSLPTAIAGFVSALSVTNVTLENCTCVGRFEEGCFWDRADTGPHSITNIKFNGGVYRNHSNTVGSSAIKAKYIADGSISRDTIVQGFYAWEHQIDADLGRVIAGDVITFSKQLSTSLITTTGYQFNRPVFGSFIIEDMAIETGSTGFGAATNIIFEKVGGSPQFGTSIFYEEAITNLPGYTTRFLTSGSVYGSRIIISSPSYIKIRTTGADLTGSDFKLTFVLRAIADSSGFKFN